MPRNPAFLQHLERLREKHEAEWRILKEALAHECTLRPHKSTGSDLDRAIRNFIQSCKMHNECVHMRMEGVLFLFWEYHYN